MSTIASTENDPVAKGLYDSIYTYNFVVFTHFLCDILGTLTYLSCFFQQDNLDFSQVESAVEGTIATIKEAYLECDDNDIGGKNLQRILKIDNPLIFDDHEVVQRQTDEHDCFSTIRMFVSVVIDNIKERFPDLPVWSSLRIFDPHAYPPKVT